MGVTIELNEVELQLVGELLERERAELHGEIRHSRLSRVREQLRERKARVEALIERLRSVREPVAGK
ncbi:MAG: hypothetical protein D6741_09430 [Planctomycetota bacterium]|nr:MAG: hypothetical protein D6741_09430 [Planctomycetota bacterium]